ncbi:MAG: 3-phenylpropionate/trans-cinnamate dioxygenase ferredoxin reductase component [Actinomycetota bacterium]|nr:3-phenylpropionate/trans-cinnamate dioxygenase ferredoxin reductase component [Actinomycetota bacterium]
MQRVVVVGSGLAGLQTVAALRAQGYAGELTMVGAEPYPPYDRPPLSKAVLLGEADDSTLDADWDAWAVTRLPGRTATGVRDGVLETDVVDLEWDGLVVATGAQPLRLPGADAALTLRTRDDALRLRGRLRPGTRLVIVGAGWIGAEVATAAVKAGVHVTVVEALDAPLATALPPECGQRMLPWWAAVDLRLGTSVLAVEPGSVHLDDGNTLAADTVLVGVGARPATSWLAGAPIDLAARGAVAVDGHLRTSMPGVWAVGDVAAWASERYATRMHVEHWDNALHAPAVAATTMLGGDATWDPVPYFWSEQWGRMVQYAGHHPAGDRVVWRDEGVRWAAFWLTGDRLVAALAVDRPRDLVQARRLMERGRSVDVARLADPGVPVKEAALPPA